MLCFKGPEIGKAGTHRRKKIIIKKYSMFTQNEGQENKCKFI